MKNNFDKLELKFYTAKDFDSTNIVILSYYDGEDEAPTFLYTMDGLKEEKVWLSGAFLYMLYFIHSFFTVYYLEWH